MDAFLLTWNPKHFAYDNLAEHVAQVRHTGMVQKRWSTGGRKAMQPGDHIFLMRLGREPRGIIGFGRATSTVFQDAHWSGDASRSTNYVLFEMVVLLDPDQEQILDLSTLRAAHPEFNWTPQGSGILIPPHVADDLHVRIDALARRNLLR